MSCIILGDCIAIGLATVIKGCVVAAHVGWSSSVILAHAPAQHVTAAFISSGTNDASGMGPVAAGLADRLRATRARLSADRIVWIVPQNQAGPIVEAVAASFGDKSVHFTPGSGGLMARLHPRSYSALAAQMGK